MSVELISVLIAVLAVGATLGGLILTATRGLTTACHRRREMSTIVVTIVLSLMGLSSCGEAEETTSRSTATSEEELAAQLGTDTEPVDAGHNRNIDVGTLSARAGAPTDGKILARWEPSPEMAKTLRLPFFEKATLTYRAGKMILVSQYGDGGRMERVLVERPAGKSAERKFDLQTQERPEYFTLSETGVVRYFSWEGREFKTASVTFIDPNAMNIGNNVQQRPCIPTKLSSAAMELVRLYDQLHAFKDDPEFIRVGFAGAPYSAWLQAIERHRDTNSGLELLDELGFLPGELMMLGMNYLGEDLSESDLSFIEDSERKIQAGLAAARCTELGSVQETIQAASEARRAYVDPMSRPPAAADDFDERVVNPCIAAEIARNPELDGVTPWEVRNIYPEIYDPLVAQMRDVAAPFLVEFGDTPRTRNILFDRLRADCIRGTRGEGSLNWSEAEVRELLSISQEEATQYEIPLLNVNGEPYFAGELCDSRWVKLTPITADTEVGRHLSDTGWLCESTTSARFCHTLDGELGWEQGFFSCSSSERSNAYWLQEWKRSQ